MHTSCARVAQLPGAFQRFLAVSFLQVQSALLCVWPDLVGMAHNHHGMSIVETLRDWRNVASVLGHAIF
eukprot:11312299-Prorocentrum_lima.AAC.1